MYLYFRIESLTRKIDLFAALGITIDSRAGDISATSLTDLKLQAKHGAVSHIMLAHNF